MKATNVLFALAAAGALVACAPAVAPPSVPPAHPESASIVTEEGALFRGLAAVDPRLATRIGESPADDDVRAMLERAATKKESARRAVVVGGSLDPFATDVRETELAFLIQRFEADTRASTSSPERTLAHRYARAEAARAKLEGDLVTYGGDLLLAATAVVRDATEEPARATADAWLAERLGDVDDAFATKKTSVAARREVEDTLDPLERALVEGGGAARFPRSFAVLTKLRETTGEAKMLGESGLPQPTPQDLAAPLVLLGDDRKPEDIGRELVAAEAALAKSAKDALATLSDHEADAARLAAGKRLALRAPCKLAVQGSSVRSLPSAPEREAGCLAVRMVADAKTDRERAEAWTLAHDRVAVAVWAIVFHGGGVSLDSARGKAQLLSLPEEPTKSALLRRAALKPAVTIGPGAYVALLAKDGNAEVARAAKILAFGEGDYAARKAFVEAAK